MRFRKILSSMLLFAVVIFLNTVMAEAALNKESLISSSSNPASGKISFYLTVPAKTKASYTVRLEPNNKNAAIDSISGVFNNTKSVQVKKKITVSVNYYSTKYKYKIRASYIQGNGRYGNSYTDTDQVSSLIPKNTFCSDKFTWTKAKVKQYKNQKTVEVVAAFGSSIVLDLLVSKGKCTAAVLGIYSASGFFSDIVSSRASSDIRNTAVEGWGYKMKAVPNSSRTSYHVYLLIYNSKNKLAETVDCGWTKIPAVMKVIK